MRIDCPHCGERDRSEFTYLGDASKLRPQGKMPDEQAMFDYVYIRANPAGEMEELWYHAAGCHAWLLVTRNTVTHSIAHVEPARETMLKRKMETRHDARPE